MSFYSLTAAALARLGSARSTIDDPDAAPTHHRRRQASVQSDSLGRLERASTTSLAVLGTACSTIDDPDAAPTCHHERQAKLQPERFTRFISDWDERRCFFITGKTSYILDESDQAYRNLIECVHPLSAPPLPSTAAHQGSLEFEQAWVKGGGVTTASNLNMVTMKESGPSSLSERGNRGSPTTTARDDINDSEGDEDDGDESDSLDALYLSPNGHHPIINSIMKEFCAWWEAQLAKAGLRTAGAGQQEAGSSSARADFGYGRPSRPSQRTPAHRPLKRRRDRDRSEGDSDGEDAEDGDSGGPNQQSIRLRKFACPFFKRNPGRFAQDRGACRGPGWDEPHRVKAHIYSRHGPLTHCPRCHSTFDTDTLRDEHLQQDPICTRVEAINLQQFDRITPQQKAALMQRPRLPATATESKGERQWKLIYSIVFPDEYIPSPYYEPNDLTQGSWDMCVRMQRDTPRFVRRRLEEAFSPVLQQMQGEVLDAFYQFRDNLRPGLGTFWEAMRNEELLQLGPSREQPAHTTCLRNQPDDSRPCEQPAWQDSAEDPTSSAAPDTTTHPGYRDAATQTLHTDTHETTPQDTLLEHFEQSRLPDFQYQHGNIALSGSADDVQTSSGLMPQCVNPADLQTDDGYGTLFNYLDDDIYISRFLQMPESD